MIPPKRFDIFPLTGGCSEGLESRCVQNMVITYTVRSKGKDQPGKVANPARGQRNRENDVFPVPVRA